MVNVYYITTINCVFLIIISDVDQQVGYLVVQGSVQLISLIYIYFC